MHSSVAERCFASCDLCESDAHTIDAHIEWLSEDYSLDQLRAQVANDTRRLRVRVVVVGMPEVDAAIAAGHVRGEIRAAARMGAEPIELTADEEVIARAPLALRWNGRTFKGEAILISKRDALPRLKLGANDERLTELARVLAGQAVQS